MISLLNKPLFDWPIRLKWKRTSGNSLSPLGTKTKIHSSAVSQTPLTGIRLGYVLAFRLFLKMRHIII